MLQNQAESQSASTPAAQIREGTMRGVGIREHRDATVSVERGGTIDDNGNTVHWAKEILGKVMPPTVNGHNNKVGLSKP